MDDYTPSRNPVRWVGRWTGIGLVMFGQWLWKLADTEPWDTRWANDGAKMSAWSTRYHAAERKAAGYREALAHIAQEPAPGTTVSCRNIAKKALADGAEVNDGDK